MKLRALVALFVDAAFCYLQWHGRLHAILVDNGQASVIHTFVTFQLAYSHVMCVNVKTQCLGNFS